MFKKPDKPMIVSPRLKLHRLAAPALVLAGVVFAASNIAFAQKKPGATAPKPSQVQFENGQRTVVPFVFEDNAIALGRSFKEIPSFEMERLLKRSGIFA